MLRDAGLFLSVPECRLRGDDERWTSLPLMMGICSNSTQLYLVVPSPQIALSRF